MQTSDFFYKLPQELIAQQPAPAREQARMMVVNRKDGTISHRRAADLPAILQRGDLLVLNNTKVIPARLRGRKLPSGGAVELLLYDEIARDEWRALWHASRPLRCGMCLELAEGRIQAKVLESDRDTVRLHLEYRGALFDLLEQCGEVPLPPYIKRPPNKSGSGPTAFDRERYQTVFAKAPGSVAAPTAGLHFTHALLDALAGQGVRNVEVTLHVGPGTFRPVTVPEIEQHHMEGEHFRVSAEAAAAINAVKRAGGRIVAVGSTVVRTLETVGLPMDEAFGTTDLFIYPPFKFAVVDVLLTNFHLPGSTLLMMVYAFGGMDLMRRAYAEAVRERYRFYSYGDCMLIL